MLEKTFKLSEHNTTVKTEVIAGFTTFLTMAYIIFVNPQMLAATGMDSGAGFVATCLAATIGCFIMGFYANYPVALAPGMDLMPFSPMLSCWIWATHGRLHWAQLPCQVSVSYH